VLGHQGHQPQRLENIQGVVGNRTIGSETYRDSRRAQRGYWCGPHRQLEIRLRRVGHAAGLFGQDLDVGFGHAGAFGGAVATPTMDRLATNGLRYNTFHTTALCSPTRAALRALVHGQLARPGRSSFWASGWLENGTLHVDLSEDEPPTRAPGPFSERRCEEVLQALYLAGRPEHLPDAIDATLMASQVIDYIVAKGAIAPKVEGRIVIQ